MAQQPPGQVFATSYRAPPLPLIEISGGPRERGRQYGELASKRIRLGYELYAGQLEQAKVGLGQLRELVEKFDPIIAQFDASYSEEMHGIAEGAGLEYSAVLLLNARTEILKLARTLEPLPITEVEADEPDGCTGVIVLPSQTASGQLIHGLNWDWKAECAETAVLLKVRRDDGPEILTFAEAGQLARAGFNSAGLSVTANYLECERDYRELGVPMPFIRRKILEQERFALAIHIAYTTRKSGSVNLMLGHAAGVAIDFECAPEETFPVYPNGGLLVHANHFQSTVALTKLIDKGVMNVPDSLYRDTRVRSLIEPHLGRVTRHTVKEALFDDFESPWSVCRPPRQSLTSNLSATVAMLIMEPASGSFEVSMMPALNRDFQRFGLESDKSFASERSRSSNAVG